MLPPGPLLLFSPDPALHNRLRQALSDDGTPHSILPLKEGIVTVGCVHPDAAAPRSHWSMSRDETTGGIFDGFLFEESSLEHAPDAMLDLEDTQVLRAANGMFLAVGADGFRRRARVITDPWGTLPIYHGERNGSMLVSTSIPFIRSILRIPDDAFFEEGVAQFLTFGKILDGSTLVQGIRRVGRARVVDIWEHGGSIQTSERRYHEIVIAPEEYPGIEHDTTGAFATAMESITRRAGECLVVTLSGGLDSRVIAAAAHAGGHPVTLATQFSAPGNDAIIAREVAAALTLPHREVVFPTALPLTHAREYTRATNGMVSFASYHMMWAYPDYARLGDVMIDGAHTWIEGRWFLRNTANRIRSKEDLFRQTRDMLVQHSVLHLAHDGKRLAAMAEEVLRSLLPEPAVFASPVCAADTFNAEHLMPAHHVDLALLQSRWCRFVSPYYDLRYTALISRIAERRRWRQEPQLWMLRAFAPQVASIARSYADVRTFATANPLLSRIPVAANRALRLAARLTGLDTLSGRTLARPSCVWRIDYSSGEPAGVVPGFLDPDAVRVAVRRAVADAPTMIPVSAGGADPLLPILHLL